MSETAVMTLRPNIRSFLTWVGLLEGFLFGVCILYYTVKFVFYPSHENQFSHVITHFTVTSLALISGTLILLILPASIYYFAIKGTYWEVWPGGIAICRDGKRTREIPWEDLERVTVLPFGIRLKLRTSSYSPRIRWCDWSEASRFARYCREGAGSCGAPGDPNENL